MVQTQNQVIADWLESHKEEIEQGEIRVFAVDECHTQAGDVCGYGWGNREERCEVEIENYRDSQSYYGALDCREQTCIISPCERANSSATITFVEHLLQQSPGAKIVLIWDGASYHRSAEFRAYLEQVNAGSDWRVHCLRFAPYAPQENPIENIWGQIKQLLRQFCHRCRSFKMTKRLFELFIRHRLFTMPNLKTYGAFSNLI